MRSLRSPRLSIATTIAASFLALSCAVEPRCEGGDFAVELNAKLEVGPVQQGQLLSFATIQTGVQGPCPSIGLSPDYHVVSCDSALALEFDDGTRFHPVSVPPNTPPESCGQSFRYVVCVQTDTAAENVHVRAALDDCLEKHYPTFGLPPGDSGDPTASTLRIVSWP